jgi:hypothetical protein
MSDIVIETLRALVVGGILLSLLKARHAKGVGRIGGWCTLVFGFGLIFFGTLIDITDNFEELNRFVIIGNTGVEAFLEKIVGYLLGFVLLAIGIRQWLKKLIEQAEMVRQKHELEMQEERLKVLRSTMVTVQDIVNNALNSMQLFQLKAMEQNALDPESLDLMSDIIHDTAAKLNRIAELDSTPEKPMAVGVGIDYEQRAAETKICPSEIVVETGVAN